MYLPQIFAETDQVEILDFMQANAFGTLITVDNGVPFASHIPFLVEQGEKLILSGHFAKPNPQWRHLEEQARVLAIFQGPHAYVSPTWYEGAGVPTWNYTAVHAYGTARVIHDKEWLRALVESLSAVYEGSGPAAWKPDYADKMLDAIVGFEIVVDELQAKYKLSQNRSQQDQCNVIQALQAGGDNGQEVADLMEKRMGSPQIKHGM